MTAGSASTAGVLHYEGCNFFRQRLVLATVSGRPVTIRRIRSTCEHPGLRDFEASFVRLLDKLCDGAHVLINETGTCLKYTPGQIVGGNVVHDCPPTRSVTYFLEAIVLLAPFAKTSVSLLLRGVTNDDVDVSIDTFKAVTLPLLQQVGIVDVQCKTRKRGVPPLGGGEVLFSCPVVKQIAPCAIVDEGKVKRVRGVAFTANVTPQFASRMVDAVRGELNDFLPDVWIFTDHMKGDASGLSQGYGVSLVAETMKGVLKSADAMTLDGDAGELGRRCARRLLAEVAQTSVVDSTHQALLLHFMALADDVKPSSARLGKLTPASVQYLRHLRDFLGITFRLKKEEESVVASCIGMNVKNLGRRTF